MRPCLQSLPARPAVLTSCWFPPSAIVLRRSLASASSAPIPYEVFDRTAKRRQRDRAAARDGGERSRTVDYLRKEITERLVERFEVSSSTAAEAGERGRRGRDGDRAHSELATARLTSTLRVDVTWGEQDVKDKPKKVLEICSGPGLFAQALDGEMVEEVELIDSSGPSLHPPCRRRSLAADISHLARTERALHRDPDSSFDEGLSSPRSGPATP